LTLFTLDVSRYVDDMIADSYASLLTMREVVKVLVEEGARGWPADIKRRLKIPFAECKLAMGRAYFRGCLMIDPEDAKLHL
jgi:hypothetical protein